MEVIEEYFSEYQGQKVNKYTLINEKQTKLSVLNFAGIIQNFSVLDDEKRVNLIFASEDLTDYTNNPFCINRVIGRTAGRISNAVVELDGKKYQLEQNENQNNLHGGSNGLGNQFFDVTVDKERNKIVLSTTQTEKIDQFPGDLELKISYQLSEDDQVKVEFEARQKEKDGYFNPTIHSYFNIADDVISNLDTQLLKINAKKRLELNDQKQPTGNFIENTDAYDFFKAKHIEKELAFDDIYAIEKSADNYVATLFDSSSKRKLNIYANANALVIFNGLNLTDFNGGQNHFAKDANQTNNSIALEAQMLPDSMHHENFESVLLQKDQSKSYTIIYEYKKEK